MGDIKKRNLKPKKLRKVSSPGALVTELETKLNAEQVQALIDASPAPSFDPSMSAEIFEDFMLTSLSHPGLYQWNESQGGTGSDSGVRIGPIEAELNHPGCFMGQTGTTNTGFGGGNNGFDIPNFTFGNGVAYRLDMLVWIDALNDGVDDYQVAAGFSDTADPYGYNAAAAVFVYNNTSLNWQVESCGQSTFQLFDTGVPVTSGWHKLSITCNAAGTDLRWYVDDIQVAQTTTASEIPQDLENNWLGLSFRITKQAGTNNRQFFVDYLRLKLNFTTPR